MKLRVGKISPKLLKEIVYKNLGVFNERVLLGPSIGEDAAIIDMGKKVLVVHTDPITGAIENIGRLSVYISTNDVATRGAIPLWLSLAILLPEKADKKFLKKIVYQIDKAAKEIGVSIVSGHTEVTPGLNRPIIVSTAFGEAEKGKYVISSNAKPGDLIILTKSVAIEGTLILANELEKFLKKKVGKKIVKNAKKYVKLISIKKEALAAISTNSVNAMHDPTEGGILGGIQEICIASNIGAKIYESKVPISYETKKIIEALKIDPLKTISSGALLISARREKAEKIIKAIKNVGIKATIIGEFTKEKRLEIIRKNGNIEKITEIVQEEIWKTLEEILIWKSFK